MFVVLTVLLKRDVFLNHFTLAIPTVGTRPSLAGRGTLLPSTLRLFFNGTVTCLYPFSVATIYYATAP